MEIYDWEDVIEYLLNVNSFYDHPKCKLTQSGGLIYIKEPGSKPIKRSPENALKFLNAHIQF